MPPRVKKLGKVSATTKVVDDFLASSSVPAGQLERQANEKKK